MLFLFIYLFILDWQRWATEHIYTSKEVNIRGQSGQKSHELNVRSVMAFCEIGKGFESMKTFSRLMIMAEPTILRHTMASAITF